ncbi:MAG: hypothetical protein HYX23_01615 [Candidatus Zambryskibacteria bacterium]|nr:hypothetical protein [Candidatus Zambryskibacteria bacterium]
MTIAEFLKEIAFYFSWIVGQSALIYLIVSRFRRRRIRKSGIGGNRLFFAVRELAVSQAVFLTLFAGATALTGGLLWLALPPSLFVFNNVFTVFFIFTIEYLRYPKLFASVKQSQIPVVASSESMRQWVGAVLLGIAFPIFLFAAFNGQEIPYGIFLDTILVSGNERLIQKQEESIRNNLFYLLAKQKQDFTICNNITYHGDQNFVGKFQCYQAADPEYPTYQKTCTLYTKAGRGDYADYEQRDCIFAQLYEKVKSANDVIDCDAIAKTSATNIQIDVIRNECLGLQLIQKAVITRDSKICDQILTAPYTFSDDTQKRQALWIAPHTFSDEIQKKQAACLVHFQGTTQWQNSCERFDNLQAKKMALCPGSNPKEYELAPINTPPYYFR